MAHVQRRETASGTRYRVVYRAGGRQYADVFADAQRAAVHLALVEKIGGLAARAVLGAKEASPQGTETLAAYALAYVDGLRNITAGTRKDYRGMVANRLTGTPLGETPLVAVTKEAVEKWVDAMPVAVKTRRNYHALVSGVLEHAAEKGKIHRNPAKGITVKADAPADEMVVLTRGEFFVLLHELPEQYRPVTLFLAGTGCRWGEATALQVGDLDLDAVRPVAHIRRAWKRTGTGRQEMGPPKTAAGVRTISLPGNLVDLLRGLTDGKRRDDFVFTNTHGKALRLNNFHDLAWQPALNRLNEDGRLTKRPRVHSLRHYHASQMLALGVPMFELSKRLGHESITTTINRYSHLMPDYLDTTAAAAALALSDVLPEIEG